MKIDSKKALEKLCLGLVFFCVLTSNAFAIIVNTIKYDELQPAGAGTDGLGFIWRLQWDGVAGDLLAVPTGPLPDSETYWESRALFSVPASGDEPTVTFSSKLHKRPDALGHLGDQDRTQALNFITFETALFTSTMGDGTFRLESKSIDHPSDSAFHHKDFVFVDFIKANGQLFFEMRGEHVLVSESSAVALFLLGFLGLFSRRWL
ncbi:hypothetical protein GCM10011613_29870 [Cellvibrio zantedeschiae]|uniref:PEP-CTERM protein-sorting domain-containing protein n=1 Tax=Cellvibrio zantedeschiae TaxID=1237077 RepID=A0ABQ3B7L7_9GAMM|nr:hypothetical protein [Cellvibrio zantedeschiae]GGY83048.1 hypothetical protein GCM10011613_29870 [Cellvibrio zantedeschiae]